MPNGIDHALVMVLAVLFPIRASTFGYRRLRLAAQADLPRVRLSVYRQAILLQWVLSLAVVLLWIAQRRPWSALGLIPHLTPGLIGVLAGLAVIVVVVVRQRRAALASDEALEDVRRRMRHLERMLPGELGELRWFYRLSVTAGVCEELLYRGYMIWYLSHWLGLVQAIGVSSLVFGVGHSYQGIRGVIVTGLVGVFLATVYALSGSLIAPMLIHALMDAHSGQIAFVAFRREREMRETAGESPGDEVALPLPPVMVA
jgi:membrane protease YdiL (CAAX protease family)